MLRVQVESVRLLDDNGNAVLSEITLPVTKVDRALIRRLIIQHGPIEQPNGKANAATPSTNPSL